MFKKPAAAKKVAVKVSLAARKKAAMRKAASSQRQPAEDARRAFGFFPSDVAAEVLRWPKL